MTNDARLQPLGELEPLRRREIEAKTVTAEKLVGDVTAAGLPNSGATAGTYGESADKTLEAGGTFKVPKITVDAKGRITAISEITLTLPAAETAAE